MATARQTETDAAVAITTAKDAVADLVIEISISRSFDAEESEDLASLRAAEALAVADLDKARDDLAELEPVSDPRDLQKLVAATDPAHPSWTMPYKPSWTLKQSWKS